MAKRKIAVYVGRFQPFHAGHYSVYQNLVKRFGKENVFIGTSDKQDPKKSPFSFDDKKDIITNLFPKIPSDKVQHVKNPYAPTEILSRFPDDTEFVTAVSEKDADRLAGSRYFQDYDASSDGGREGYKTKGYFVVAPEHQMSIDGENISGTTIRNYFRDPYRSAEDKVNLFKKLYGKFNKGMYKKIVRTLEATSKKTPESDPDPRGGPMPADDAQSAPEGGIDPTARVTNPQIGRASCWERV